MKHLWALVYGDQSKKRGEMIGTPEEVFAYVLTQVDYSKPKPIEIHMRIAE
jgi:hypothetical protein